MTTANNINGQTDEKITALYCRLSGVAKSFVLFFQSIYFPTPHGDRSHALPSSLFAAMFQPAQH